MRPEEGSGDLGGEALDGALLGGRYRPIRLLGRGGMASVYEAADEATARRVAVKRLHVARAGDPHTARLFELEFHTLAQLAHPRIVAVHDYHKLDGGAFYTMELLDGGDLSAQRRLPWKEVCAVLCDVCSALSLLHSRRLVHRDVTPRNIRCAADGKAKLIDFGAMVPFGTHTRTVGTPSFTAPEALTGQPLDGRADLYALGATAYYLLTGRNAYPARTFANLRNAWRSQPALPSRHAPDVPPALDQLVMSLLGLAPSRRPASAGAVIERLTAIAGIELGERLAVQRAFLTTPSLVGRDEVMARIRRHMMRAAHGRGGSVFITGPRGVGRSRMVDACVLEARLASGLVLRADADDARAEPFGSARALLQQLSTELPDRLDGLLAPYAPVLWQLWPPAARLLAGAPPALEPLTQRPLLQQALLGLLLDVSRQALLVVASDDVDRIDEPTRALLALLADRAPERRIAVVTAAERDAAAADVEGLSLLRQGEQIELAPQSLEDSERLLISVFGDVPNVRLLASRLHEVSGGLPAETMQLAQHLLDRDLIRYRDGGWLLPSTIARTALPDDVSSALRARLMRLDANTRRLAQAIALSGLPTVTLEQCGHLCGETDVSLVLARADALVTAQVLHVVEGGYALGQRRWAPLLLGDIDPQRKPALHARIAELLVSRPGAEFHAAAHLLAAGDAGPAIDLLLAHRQRFVGEVREHPAHLADEIRALPSGWHHTLEAAWAAALQLGRRRVDAAMLRQMLVMYSVVGGELQPELVREFIADLHACSGLADYALLDESMPARERLQRALAAAQARHEATPSAERGFAPGYAIAMLVQAIAHVIAATGVSGDFAFLSAQPSLWPLAPLSPAIAVVQLNVESTCHLFAGRMAQARQAYVETLARLSEPGAADLSPSLHRYVELAVHYATALVEAYCGLPSVDRHLEVLERDPLFEVNAWRLRMLQALRRGDVEAAAVCERKAERLRIRNASAQFFEGGDIWLEGLAHAEIGDVARIHHTLERIDAMAARHPVWAVGATLARGQIQLLRGEAAFAARTFEDALARCVAGGSLIWPAVARGYLTALGESGQVAQARARGDALLAQARAAGLTVQIAELHFALATVELAGGDCDAALRHLRDVGAIRQEWPLAGVFGGACHELAARIALARRDQAGFHEAATACARTFVSSRHPMLIARHERLLQDAERAQLVVPPSMRQAALADQTETTTDTTLDDGGRALGRALARCSDAEERIARVLSFALAGGAGEPRGMLYLLRGSALRLARQRGACPDPAAMDALVAEFLRGELEGSGAVDADDLVTSTVDAADWTGPGGARFAPALLSHPSDGGLAITGVLVFDVQAHNHPRDSLLAKVSLALASHGDVIPLRVEAEV